MRFGLYQALLQHGGDAVDLANSGWTELHTAALLASDSGVIRALIDEGLDAGVETSSGWTALHLAAFSNGNPGVVAALIDRGADLAQEREYLKLTKTYWRLNDARFE